MPQKSPSMKIFIYSLASLLLALNTHSQDATNWIMKGNQTFKEADYDDAIHFFAKARNEFRKSNDKEQEFNVSLRVISSLLKSSQFAEAENEIEDAKVLSESGDKADFVEFISLCAQLKTKQEKTKEALALYDSVISLSKDPTVHTKAIIRKGITHIGNHDLKGAQAMNDEANKLVKTSGISDGSLLSSLYDLEAQIRWHTGDFSGALRWYHKALPLRVDELGASHPEVGSLYNKMGIMYTKLASVRQGTRVLYDGPKSEKNISWRRSCRCFPHI